MVTALECETRRIKVLEHLTHDDAVERIGREVRLFESRAVNVEALASRDLNCAFVELQPVDIPAEISSPFQISTRSATNLQQTLALSAIRQIKEEEASE